MQKILSYEEFCELYIWAKESARSSWDWAQLDLERVFALDQSQIEEEWEDMIVHSVESQWMMILFEFYQIMASRRQLLNI